MNPNPLQAGFADYIVQLILTGRLTIRRVDTGRCPELITGGMLLRGEGRGEGREADRGSRDNRAKDRLGWHMRASE